MGFDERMIGAGQEAVRIITNFWDDDVCHVAFEFDTLLGASQPTPSQYELSIMVRAQSGQACNLEVDYGYWWFWNVTVDFDLDHNTYTVVRPTELDELVAYPSMYAFEDNLLTSTGRLCTRGLPCPSNYTCPLHTVASPRACIQNDDGDQSCVTAPHPVVDGSSPEMVSAIVSLCHKTPERNPEEEGHMMLTEDDFRVREQGTQEQEGHMMLTEEDFGQDIDL
eukprot:CAMPEP_0174229342 /NCGR_PEP_ID=MMETSP0417-20130205/344_1 /TAXON_ID=242541 /ORGANISM="Mayorella sp, Strain BSH-02190019" /LENGTH=222 /DNA_ID=CAMNT_0015306879 /DNA_START=144 /DNA_END=812 /DNA_ORIENTATION=+